MAQVIGGAAAIGAGAALFVLDAGPAALKASFELAKDTAAKNSLELGVKATIAIDETTAAASVAVEAVAARVATNPVLVAAGANGDKIVDAVSGAFEPGPPPMTPVGVGAAIIKGIIEDEIVE